MTVAARGIQRDEGRGGARVRAIVSDDLGVSVHPVTGVGDARRRPRKTGTRKNGAIAQLEMGDGIEAIEHVGDVMADEVPAADIERDKLLVSLEGRGEVHYVGGVPFLGSR